jgi:hypothetical protein
MYDRAVGGGGVDVFLAVTVRTPSCLGRHNGTPYATEPTSKHKLSSLIQHEILPVSRHESSSIGS